MSNQPTNKECCDECSEADIDNLTKHVHDYFRKKEGKEESTVKREETTQFKSDKIHLLKKVTKQQIDKLDWDFNREREFLEDQFCQRSNFLLVAYGLVVTAAASTSDKSTLLLVLLFGCIITCILAWTLHRVYKQVDRLLTIIHQLPEHPIKFINESVIYPNDQNQGRFKRSINKCFNGNGIVDPGFETTREVILEGSQPRFNDGSNSQAALGGVQSESRSGCRKTGQNDR